MHRKHTQAKISYELKSQSGGSNEQSKSSTWGRSHRPFPRRVFAPGFQASSGVRREELPVGCFYARGRRGLRQDQDAVPERGACVRRQGKVQLFLPIAEDLLPERIGCKQPVATSVPVGRIARVLGMVEDGDRDR